ncbi:Zinc finger protein CONSTANS-like [Castilleja foliolosa]|uniref:Zinc finger protein CONSTANS-like n=1 Tax=Castilleja foliolosa TaxID=1961234 RepID=A0ABD3C2W9_9LAMI
MKTENRANTFTQMLKLETTGGEHTAAKTFLCDACNQSPATFFCKADAASLCSTCDSDIHSANPLARRHHRVPIFSGGETAPVIETAPYGDIETVGDEYEAASWLLLNPVKNDTASFCGVVDEYLDLDSYNNPCPNINNNQNEFNDDPFNVNHQQHEHYNIGLDSSKCCRGGDSVVPIQLGLEYGSTNAQYSFPAMSHTVSLSQLDIGIVPESTTMSENSISHTRQSKGTSVDLFSRPLVQVPTQLSATDREARVLRYREKKKARKFEKTIRYASRKAYAETRPRVKGRFAKRTDQVAEVEVDQMFSTSVMAESGYGIVPSFLS